MKTIHTKGWRIVTERPGGKSKAGIVLSVAVIMTISAIAIYFSYITPWLGDDLGYCYNVKLNHTGVYERVTNIAELFESQYWHYIYVNGRYVAHWLVQLYDCLLGKEAFAISNGIVYALMLLMLMVTCGVRMENWKGVLTLGCLMLTGLSLRMNPAFQMYIWMYLLVLVYLWLLMNYTTRKWWMLVLLTLFSIICGNAHESLNAGVVVGAALYFVFKKKMTLTQILMSAGFCVGLAFLLLSPRTIFRMGESTPAMSLEYRILGLINFCRSIPMCWILITITLYKLVVRREKIKTLLAKAPLWWGIWLGCMLINLSWGFQGGRALLGGELSAIIISVKLSNKKTFTPLWLSLLFFMVICFLHQQWKNVEKMRGYIQDIHRQAVTSPGSNIYIDFDYNASIGPFENYVGEIAYLDDCHHSRMKLYRKFISLYYCGQWGVDKVLEFYPTALRPYMEGTADTTAGNILVEYAPSHYLLVQNKRHPARFYVSYERDIPFFHKEYPRKELSLNPFIYEDDNWIASVVNSSYYNKYYPATFHMEPPQE